MFFLLFEFVFSRAPKNIWFFVSSKNHTHKSMKIVGSFWKVIHIRLIRFCMLHFAYVCACCMMCAATCSQWTQRSNNENEPINFNWKKKRWQKDEEAHTQRIICYLSFYQRAADAHNSYTSFNCTTPIWIWLVTEYVAVVPLWNIIKWQRCFYIDNARPFSE